VERVLPGASLGSEHHLVNLACPASFAEFDAAGGFLGEPLLDGEGEAGFAALADLGGERGTRRGGEELFAALAAGDESRGELAEEVGVDEGDADFERMGHRGPVHVAQELIAEVERRLQRGDAGEGVAGIGGDGALDDRQHVQPGQPLGGDLVAEE